MDQFTRDRLETDDSLFSIKGDLDGADQKQDYADVKQFIGLLIGKEEFLLPIEVMNEIIMVTQITYVPSAPRFIEGVINLRGKILPAIDLRQIIGLEARLPGPQSRIIICHSEDIMVGLIVDGITYVISLTPDQVQNQSLSTKGTGSEIIGGISKRGDQVNGIIDIGKVILETGVIINRHDNDAA